MSQNKNKMSIIPILNFRGPCLPSHSICLGWKSALKQGRPSPELAHHLFTACSFPKHEFPKRNQFNGKLHKLRLINKIYRLSCHLVWNDPEKPEICTTRVCNC